MWTFKRKEFGTKDIPSGAVGFVYLIINENNGMKYIGRKVFYFSKTLPPLKGMIRKIKTIKESDWETYCGSNKELIKHIKGGHQITKEILSIEFSKGDLNYGELAEQVQRNVLKDCMYYNDYIMVRISGKHLGK